MPPLPDRFLDADEALLWHGGVDMRLMIRRQLKHVAWGAGLAALLAAAILLTSRHSGWILVPILIVPSQLVAQGIARRNRERDVYFLTNQRVGIWTPPAGPAARMAGMEDVASGSLTLPLGALDRVDRAPTALTLHPKSGLGHFPIRLTDMADPFVVAERIDQALQQLG